MRLSFHPFRDPALSYSSMNFSTPIFCPSNEDAVICGVFILMILAFSSCWGLLEFVTGASWCMGYCGICGDGTWGAIACVGGVCAREVVHLSGGGGGGIVIIWFNRLELSLGETIWFGVGLSSNGGNGKGGANGWVSGVSAREVVLSGGGIVVTWFIWLEMSLGETIRFGVGLSGNGGRGPLGPSGGSEPRGVVCCCSGIIGTS
jgi:hypothetical protein